MTKYLKLKEGFRLSVGEDLETTDRGINHSVQEKENKGGLLKIAEHEVRRSMHIDNFLLLIILHIELKTLKRKGALKPQHK